MVNTPAMIELLSSHGMKRLAIWGRGVDTEMFRPDGEIPEFLQNLPKPILMNVGRVTIEKNLEKFYQLPMKGTKVQVGDGPMLEQYQKQYPGVHFVGAKSGEELASYYRGADVFVFPSLTDTYGLVMLESIASGVPVAAYPVTGPIDVLTDKVGVMNDDLQTAVRSALNIKDKEALHQWTIKEKSWSSCTDQFISYLQPL
jgi:glycosyltransferase involved in cell wall biosynthesis